MNISMLRIWAVVLRYYFSHIHNISKVFEFFFWPFIDIVLLGFISVGTSACKDEILISSMMIGLVYWQIAHRTNMEVSRNLLQEIWDHNLPNFFSTPLTLIEWFLGLLLISFLSLFITIPFGALSVYFIFGYNVFSLGLLAVPHIILLMFSGWIMGFLGASFLIYWGEKIDILVWAIPWIPAPFCSIYYPLEVLPPWIQKIALCLPMTYIFESIRFILKNGILSYQLLTRAILLHIIYFGATLLLFLCMFKKRKIKGF